jgi:predicted metal-dependent hydrolase
MQTQEITVKIIRKNIKHIYLRVLPDNIVQVTAPTRTSQKTINTLLNDRSDWIQKSLQKQNYRQQFQSRFLAGETHYVQGKAYPLQIHEFCTKSSIQIENNTLIVKLRTHASEEKVEEAINGWYRKHLKQTLPDLIKQWEQTLQVEVKAFGIKKMKTRWGTCNTHAHRIWLNLALAKTPPECLEYVLVHEMVHLLEASHNHRFKSLMSHYMPDWKIHEQTLKQFPVL